ncbi:hypothetical protein, partial [Aeromonas hydrophila]
SMGAGYESRMAVGTVVFFGLSLATLVTLLVVPATYHLIARHAGMTGQRDQQVDEALAAKLTAKGEGDEQTPAH